MRILLCLLALAFLFIPPSHAAAIDSLINEYRGIFIGATRDQVHEKLGSPKHEYADEDNFELSDIETARVFYDSDKKVKAIVVTYSGRIDSAPKPNVVVGEPLEARPDGGMYKMVRAQDKGFWVSYVKSAGDSPSVTITVQALPKSKS
jgi:hypothetical protein